MDLNPKTEPLQDSKLQDEDSGVSHPDRPSANTRRKTGGKSKSDISESQTSTAPTVRKRRGRPSKSRALADYSRFKEPEVQELLAKKDEEFHKLENAKKKFQDESKKLREQVKKLEGENGNIRKERDEMRSALNGYQSDLKQIIFKNQIEIMTDGELQDKFGTIFQKSKTWAEKWSSEKFSDASLAMLKEPSRPFATSRILDAAVRGDIGVAVIVNSLVNSLLCSKIFRKPFSHLKLDFRGDCHCPTEGFLEALMQRAKEKSTFSEHRLRTAVLRAIDEPLVDTSTMTTTTEVPLSQERVDHCEKVAIKVLNFGAYLLSDVDSKENEQRKCELLQIVEKASRLSGILSLQNPSLKYHFLSDISEPTFRLNDPLFTTHRRLKLENDEDDADEISESKELIGQPLDLVVTPAIVRFGDAQGGNYDREIVMYRGTTWFVKNKRRYSGTQETCNKASNTSLPVSPSDTTRSPDVHAEKSSIESDYHMVSPIPEHESVRNGGTDSEVSKSLYAQESLGESKTWDLPAKKGGDYGIKDVGAEKNACSEEAICEPSNPSPEPGRQNISAASSSSTSSPWVSEANAETTKYAITNVYYDTLEEYLEEDGQRTLDRKAEIPSMLADTTPTSDIQEYTKPPMELENQTAMSSNPDCTSHENSQHSSKRPHEGSSDEERNARSTSKRSRKRVRRHSRKNERSRQRIESSKEQKETDIPIVISDDDDFEEAGSISTADKEPAEQLYDVTASGEGSDSFIGKHGYSTPETREPQASFPKTGAPQALQKAERPMPHEKSGKPENMFPLGGEMKQPEPQRTRSTQQTLLSWLKK